MIENLPMPFRIFAVFLLLALPAAAQDELADPFDCRSHEYEIRPPKGWEGHALSDATIVFSAAKPLKAELSIIRCAVQNPTTLAQFQKQLDDHIATYNERKILFSRQVTIGGHSAYQIAATAKLNSGEAVLIFRTVVHRSHLDYYIVDCRAAAADSEKVMPLFEKSAATFKIEPAETTAEERAALARTVAALKDGAMLAKELQRETWQGVFVDTTKVGYQVQRVAAAKVDGVSGLSFEADTVLDLKKGGGTKFSVRGFFTADGRYQKMDGEEILLTEQQSEQKYRYSIVLKDGKVTVRRHMNGTDEETSFTVPEGTLLSDVSDVFRRAVSLRAKSTYFFLTLNPFEGETGCEWIEATGEQTVDDSRNVLVTFSTVDRGATFTYWFDPNGALAVIRGGARRVFHVVGMSKEEALK